MLLHIGDNKSISKNEIIVILDSRTVNKSSITRDFVERSKSNVILSTTGDQAAKSVIITEGKIYLSAISSMTLKKRLSTLQIY